MVFIPAPEATLLIVVGTLSAPTARVACLVTAEPGVRSQERLACRCLAPAS